MLGTAFEVTGANGLSRTLLKRDYAAQFGGVGRVCAQRSMLLLWLDCMPEIESTAGS